MIEIDKIYNEDCLKGMKRIEDHSIDCIIIDPPYGVLNKQSEGGKWDSVIPFEPMWEQFNRIKKPAAPVLIFGQGMFTAKLIMSNPKAWRYNLVWNKIRACGFLNARRIPLRVHEDICVFYDKLPTYNPQMRKGFPNHTRGHGGGKLKNGCYGKYDPLGRSEVITDEKFPLSIISIEKERRKQFHPTQKPVDLLRYLVRTYSNPGDLVLDCCFGSGSTILAAIQERRHYIGFELNYEYFEKAKKLIEDMEDEHE